jgi:hypothetical protein
MDVELRNRTYAFFVEHGRPPRPDELGDPDSIVAGWRDLHDGHALVLAGHDPTSIRMLNPFSCVPTAHRVEAAGRWWYGNCSWDSFGIVAALGGEGRYLTSCPDCAEPLRFAVHAGGLVDEYGAVFHCLVPAARWWDDIVFT